MIVRQLGSARRTARRVVAENWESVRLVLRNDNAGFSFHITTIRAGSETHIWYRNHIESVYCIRGEGEVELLEDGTVYPIRPGSLYLLDRHDRHRLRAISEMELACVFTPALTGQETHDADGVYPLTADHDTADEPADA